MDTGIATVCLSGSLTDKLRAAASAGFDTVEVFEPDLVVAPQRPEELRELLASLGLRASLYQPLRDVEGVPRETFTDNLRRAERKFALAARLGIDTVLLCSNVTTATVGDDRVLVEQLRRTGDAAARHGVRVAYEALAWGRFVDDYRHAWQLVSSAQHEAVGVCLDSFHVLSRGHDPAAIEEIPGERVFALQLADAPRLDLDVLSWSRHHRLFPGEGEFDLPGFLAHVVRTGFAGPLSLEVFNDVFRQTDTRRTAEHARHSLRDLEDRTARLLTGAGEPARGLRTATAVDPPVAVAAVELRTGSGARVRSLLLDLGLEPHPGDRDRLTVADGVSVVLGADGPGTRLSALELRVTDPAAALRRAAEFTSVHPPGSRVTAPDSIDLTFTGTARGGPPGGLLTGIDHVNLVHPWETFDEAVLFHRSVLRLETDGATEVAGPVGLVRSQVLRSPGGGVRLALNVAPPAHEHLVQHLAFSSDDVLEVARRARERGAELLPVPDNYHDDLADRFDLPAAFADRLRELGVLYDRDTGGEFLHFYTRTVGEVFLEVVERRGGYQGYGAPNAPVRLAAQFQVESRR